MQLSKVRSLVLPFAVVGALFACGEPGQDELEEARKLEAEGHRAEALAAYEAVVKEHAGTKAADEANEALARIHCEDAKQKVAEAWTALGEEAGRTDAVPAVDPAARDAAMARYTEAQTAAAGCAPDSTDAACAEKLTAQQQAGDALAMAYADTCAGEAHRAARGKVGEVASQANGGGEQVDLAATVRDAARAAAETCIGALVTPPQSPNLTADAIAQRVSDELLASPAFAAVKSAEEQADQACPSGGEMGSPEGRPGPDGTPVPAGGGEGAPEGEAAPE